MYGSYGRMDIYDNYEPLYHKKKKRPPKWLWLILCLLVIIGLANSIFSKEDLPKNEVATEDDAIIQNEIVEDERVSNQQSGSLSFYFYNLLSSKEKKSYNAIVDGILNMKAKIRIQETDKNTIEKIMICIMDDHPELFWCDGSYVYTSYNNYSDFSPTYLYGEQEKNSRQNQIDIQAKSILNRVQTNWTDYEKIKYVYESVITSVEYVTGAPDNQNIYSSLVNKKSVCAGYTRACQYLLQQMGIECLFVPGMVNQTEGHAWNIVKCNGNYYQMDATFGDRAFEPNTQGGIPEELNINYSYLCCSDSEIYTDRYSTLSLELPVCNLLDLNYFKMQGCYYEYYSDAILEHLRTAIFNGEKVWQCQFSNLQDYQKMLNTIKNGEFAEIVSEYYTSIGYNGQGMVWYQENDARYTISCWY